MGIFGYLYPHGSLESFPIFLKDEEMEGHDNNGGMDECDTDWSGNNLHPCGSAPNDDLGRAPQHEKRDERRKRKNRRRRNNSNNATVSEER